MNASIEDRLRSYAATLDQAADAKQTAMSADDTDVIEALPAPLPLRPRRDRRLLPIAAAAAVVLLVFGAVVAVSRGGDDNHRVTTTSVATQPTTPVTPTTPSTATPTTAIAPPARPTAADALVPFFTGAATIDQKRRAAATKSNAKFGSNGDAIFDQSDVDAVAGTDPTDLAKTIPAGMAAQLESAVLIVWSDLMSRYAAMCVSVGPYQQPDTDSDLSGCFTNGAVAAARFPADLARAKAAADPPVTPVAPDSHAAGEVAVQINAIVEGNVGCGGHGGIVFTTLEPVVWHRLGTGAAATDGTIGQTPFVAHYDPATGWFARLSVC